VAREHGVLVGDVAVDRVDGDDLRLAARVVAAAKDGERAERLVADAEPLDDRGAQLGVGVLERQAELGEAKHAAIVATACDGRVVSGTLRRASRPSAARAAAPRA